MKSKLEILGFWRLVAILFALTLSMYACASSDSDSDESTDGDVSISMKADYGSSGGSSAPLASFSVQTCATADSTDDGPHLVAGEDCDGDGGTVAFSTPNVYKIAIKKFGFYDSANTYYPIIKEAETLADSTVVDLSKPVTLDPSTDIPQGIYTSYEVEIYYVDMNLEINNANETQNIRIYLSDDNFPAEGNLGHHQGDITLIDASGDEIGWITDECHEWNSSHVRTTDRGEIEGAGGTDVQTGHKRGLYGDTDLWNNATFQQGASQDIFTTTGVLGLVATHSSVTFTFDVENVWYFEDYDANDLFNPGASGTEACAANATWSPIINMPTVEKSSN